MPVDYTFLLDAQARERIQIAKLGNYSDVRYGDFKITAAEVRAWAQNLAKLPGGRAPIDFDHKADKPGAARDTEAAGWITGVALEDGVPTATVEWTDKGRDAITNKRYLFISPTYGPWTDESGSTTPDVLQGAALTNKPFLNMAPVVNLARAEVGFAEEVAGDVIIEAPSDSRPSMPTISIKTLDALGLPKDADEAAIESAVTQLQAEPKTLEAQATEAGMVLLSTADHDALKGEAEKAGALEVRVKTLEDAAKASEFEAEFTKCLEAGRVDAKDETKAEWRELYDAAPQVALKRMASLPKIVNTTAQGSGGHSDDAGDAPAGVDVEAFELDQKVQAHMAANPGTDYLKALEAVQKER